MSLNAEPDDWDGEPEEKCWECGGDGWVFGTEMDDPLWYDPDDVYRCPNCHGSGLAKDCTYW